MNCKSVIVISVIAVALISAPAMAKDNPGRGIGTNIPDAVTDADFRSHDAKKVELGRLLMFDKILSGNENISCGTCHHALTDTGDGLSLPVGEGGVGLGKSRNTAYGTADHIPERVPRNAPPVFNLGAHEFKVLFHDGRVSVNMDPEFSDNSNCETPAGNDLPNGLDNVLACQAMFPVTSGTEMAGQDGENPIGTAAAAGNLAGPGGVWEQLAGRLQNSDYVSLFVAAFYDINDAADITYVHAANAIAAFEGANWRADNSPFDRYLRGDKKAMTKIAVEGMKLFYGGDSNGQACADCHSGKFQTDHSFHAIAMPQIGAGRGSDSDPDDGIDDHEDFGREQVTGDADDILKFRTPTLRNVALTAPYGHTGAYNTLRAVVEHHIDTGYAINNYDQSQAVLPPDVDYSPLDFLVMDDPDLVNYIEIHSELDPFTYTSEDVDLILEFLHALTDPSSIDLRSDQPFTVPSGLPLAD
ncbi:MAG: cytochrome c peroxidase [Pseudomonadota bacterium]|nr:cytochrome c peroxidase [Pseudomonadota bacterium]